MFFSFSFRTDDAVGFAVAEEVDVDETEDTFLEGGLVAAGMPLGTGKVSSSTALDNVAWKILCQGLEKYAKES